MKKLQKGQRFKMGNAMYELVEPFGKNRWKCRFTNNDISGTVCLQNQLIIEAAKLPDAR